MDTEHELAFLRGMRKCALEKEAFIGALAGGAIRTLAPLMLAGKVTNKLQSVLPKFINRPGIVGKGATMANNALNSHGIGGTLAHMGVHHVISPVVDPAVGYVADKFDGQGY
jgi:hypothetical protein